MATSTILFLAFVYVCGNKNRLKIYIGSKIDDFVMCFISSPEPLGSKGELIVYPSSRRPSVRRRRPSSVRRPFSKTFFSETAWPIKAKFDVEPPWDGGTKVYINGPGHMTKMADAPIYGKNL